MRYFSAVVELGSAVFDDTARRLPEIARKCNVLLALLQRGQSLTVGAVAAKVEENRITVGRHLFAKWSYL
jgi:hypothetical protein